MQGKIAKGRMRWTRSQSWPLKPEELGQSLISEYINLFQSAIRMVQGVGLSFRHGELKNNPTWNVDFETT